MTAINMLQAKANLSRLVDAIERGAQREIIIARNGRPVARLLVAQAQVEPMRLLSQHAGIARYGDLVVPV